MRLRRRDPSLKKALAYEKDTGGQFGKNNKSGRRSVRCRKANVNRGYRKSVNQILAATAPDEVDDCAAALKRKKWRKVPESRLLTHLDYKWSGSARTRNHKKYSESRARKIALLKLRHKHGKSMYCYY